MKISCKEQRQYSTNEHSFIMESCKFYTRVITTRRDYKKFADCLKLTLMTNALCVGHAWHVACSAGTDGRKSFSRWSAEVHPSFTLQIPLYVHGQERRNAVRTMTKREIFSRLYVHRRRLSVVAAADMVDLSRYEELFREVLIITVYVISWV